MRFRWSPIRPIHPIHSIQLIQKLSGKSRAPLDWKSGLSPPATPRLRLDARFHRDSAQNSTFRSIQASRAARDQNLSAAVPVLKTPKNYRILLLRFEEFKYAKKRIYLSRCLKTFFMLIKKSVFDHQSRAKSEPISLIDRFIQHTALSLH
jgi:hypothetical protein